MDMIMTNWDRIADDDFASLSANLLYDLVRLTPHATFVPASHRCFFNAFLSAAKVSSTLLSPTPFAAQEKDAVPASLGHQAAARGCRLSLPPRV
jgi:hypothetical protein